MNKKQTGSEKPKKSVKADVKAPDLTVKRDDKSTLTTRTQNEHRK